jgi:hypothetical protein
MTTLRSIAGDGLKERHLLVAVDGSENSRRAVSFVAAAILASASPCCTSSWGPRQGDFPQQKRPTAGDPS